MPPSSVGTARASRPASRRCSKDSCDPGAVDVVAGGVLGEHRPEAGGPGDELRLSRLGVWVSIMVVMAIIVPNRRPAS